MEFDHFDLRELYREWRAQRRTLESRLQRSFPAWVFVVRPQYRELARAHPSLFHAACHQAEEIERGIATPSDHGIGQAVLQRHAVELAQCWLRARDQYPTFGAFLDQVLQECQTERALQRWLKHLPR